MDSNFPYAGAVDLVFAPFVSRPIVCSRCAWRRIALCPYRFGLAMRLGIRFSKAEKLDSRAKISHLNRCLWWIATWGVQRMSKSRSAAPQLRVSMLDNERNYRRPSWPLSEARTRSRARSGLGCEGAPH
jgi:hypothetical protein